MRRQVVWYGVSEYLLFVALVSLTLHGVCRRYVACMIGGAAACSILNLMHEAWLVDWDVNIGWGSPMFVIGALFALPVCAATGLPWIALRRWWTRGKQ